MAVSIDRDKATWLNRYARFLIILALGITLLPSGSLNAKQLGPANQPNQSCASGLSGRIEASTTWSGQIFLAGDVIVGAAAEEPLAVLTIEPGSEIFACEDGVRLRIGDLFRPAQLRAEGSAEQPIRFRGADIDTRWGGLTFDGTNASFSGSILRHAQFTGGGGDSNATIYVLGRQTTPERDLLIEDVEVLGANDHGVRILNNEADGTPTEVRRLNVTSAARAPLLIDAAALAGLREGLDLGQNADPVIAVRATSALGGGISVDTTLQDYGVPYRIEPDPFARLDVDGSEAEPPGRATLQLEAGVRLLFPDNASFLVDNDNRLIANGTLTQPVTLAATEPISGWGGLSFDDTFTPMAGAQIDHLIISDGGVEREAALLIAQRRASTDANFSLRDVTIINSRSAGMQIRHSEEDPSPPLVERLVVRNAAGAPLQVQGSALRGLGSRLDLGDNPQPVLEILGSNSLGGRIAYDTTLRDYGVPYRLADSAFARIEVNGFVAAPAKPAVLRLEPGVEVRFPSETGLLVGDLGSIEVLGSATQPITLRATDPLSGWLGVEQLSTNQTIQRFEHLALFDSRSSEGALNFDRGGQLFVANSIISGSSGPAINFAGLGSQNSMLVRDSQLINNDVGVNLSLGAIGIVRNTQFIGNRTAGAQNIDARGSCLDAIGNYWGAANGPAASATSSEGCGPLAANAGSGNSAGENVRYRPFLTSAEATDTVNRSSIVPSEPWLIADGVSTVTLTARLLNNDGTPLAGQEVEFFTNFGTIAQPTGPTDANGIATATISSTEVGQAAIGARNLTNGQDLAAQAFLVLWRGEGERGGLITARGAPYASPNLLIEGMPFQQGFPIILRLPMRNTNSVPVSVQVEYAATRVNIGALFAPVAVVSRTLQPGESWDAAASFIPQVSGHQCVQAEVNFTLLGNGLAQSGFFREQRNLNHSPPDGCRDLNANNLIPRKPGGLGAVIKHFRNLNNESRKVNNCLNQNLRFAGMLAQANDYTSIYTPRAFNGPRLEVGPEVSAALAAAANEVGAVADRIASLDEALAITSDRIAQAGQANDISALERQLNAYRGLQQQDFAAQRDLISALDGVLALIEGDPTLDITFSPADYAAELALLQSEGLASDEREFLTAAGFNPDQIDGLVAAQIAALETQTPVETSLTGILRGLRAEAQAILDSPSAQAVGTGGNLAQSGSALLIPSDQLSSSFAVSNPRGITETITLQVRPVALPLNWGYELSSTTLELAPGASSEVRLTLVPNDGTIALDQVVQVAVEGYIGDELIGGVLINAGDLPAAAPVANNQLYLPLVLQP